VRCGSAPRRRCARFGGSLPRDGLGPLGTQLQPSAHVPGDEHDDGGERRLAPRHRAQQSLGQAHGGSRDHADRSPPAGGGVAPRAVQRDQHCSAEVRVVAPERQRPGDDGSGEDQPRQAAAPVQQRTRRCAQQEVREGDVARAAEEDRVTGAVHQHGAQDQDRRGEHGVRRARPAQERARRAGGPGTAEAGAPRVGRRSHRRSAVGVGLGARALAWLLGTVDQPEPAGITPAADGRPPPRGGGRLSATHARTVREPPAGGRRPRLPSGRSSRAAAAALAHRQGAPSCTASPAASAIVSARPPVGHPRRLAGRPHRSSRLAATSSGPRSWTTSWPPGSSASRAQRLLEERFPDAAAGSALAVSAPPDGQRLEEHPRRGVRRARAGRSRRARQPPWPTRSPRHRVGRRADRSCRGTFDEPSMEVGPSP
jgi:hypothetical protein